MCLYSRFLVGKVISQNLHWCENEPAKWMFSMCILRLLLDVPTFPQIEQLCIFDPISGLATIYWYRSLSPPATVVCADSHWKRSHGILATHSHHMVVQFGFGVKFLLAIFARVSEWTREVKALHVFAKIPAIIANLSTNCAFVSFGSSLWMSNNIFIQELLATCNQGSSHFHEIFGSTLGH